MRHDTTEPLWIPVTGAASWPSTATGIQISLDGGVTYVSATVDATTATSVLLPNGKTGTRAWISAETSGFTLTAGTQVIPLVKLVNGSDTPVMIAAGSLNIT